MGKPLRSPLALAVCLGATLVSAGHGDAPDRDLDAVPDAADLCPDEPGPTPVEIARCRWEEAPPEDYAVGCPRSYCVVVTVSDAFQPRTAAIYFPRHSATYSVAAYRAILERLELDPTSRHAIRLTGHTDEDEPPVLARSRIHALRAHLLASGIPPDRLLEEVHAPGVPDGAGRRRRVELELVADPCPQPAFIIDRLYYEKGAHLADVLLAREGNARILDDWFCLAFDHPDMRIEIIAHASEDEPAPLALSQARADELRAHLVARGIPVAQLGARGGGVDRAEARRPLEERRARQRSARLSIAK